MKSLIALVVFAVMFLPALLFVSVPQPVLAGEPIVPAECRGDQAAENCNICHLVVMIEGLVDLFIEIMLIVATIMVVVAGFRLVTSGGNVAAKESAKSLLINVIIGILIVLAAWLIVDTIIRAVIGSDSIPGFGPWNDITGDACQPAFSGGG